MSAPDKIYMHEKEVRGYSEPYGNWKIEYIRKDFLLEWANDLRENARKSRENPPSIEFDRYMEGKEATLSKLITKLYEI